MTNELQDITAHEQDDHSVIKTKEYRRFAEFCDACKRDRYIGVCYGPPGVGKTFSAGQYAHWPEIEGLLKSTRGRFHSSPHVRTYDTIVYTAPVENSAKSVDRGVLKARDHLWHSIHWSYPDDDAALDELPDDFTQLIIVDEADRLKLLGLEQLRSIFDNTGIALILIGMPGIQKRLARYPQLYSRIGFVHEFRPLSQDEIIFLIEKRLLNSQKLDMGDFTDKEALSAVLRITHGNFRLLNRLLAQIKRILEINALSVITKEVVEAARENLVIGLT